jgi:hypothetical protein
MRKAVQFVGLLLFLEGVSGAIDHVAYQPFFSLILNFFNRVIIPRVDFLTGYELYANLVLAAIGAAIVIIEDRLKPA